MTLEKFTVRQAVYKQIGEHTPLLVDIMIPKSITHGKSPVNLRFHAGHLICGSRDSMDITPPRILQHAYDNGLIIVTADYRLLPECVTVQAILDDIEDLWDWVWLPTSDHECGLTDAVNAMTEGRIQPDLEKIIATGESAGGYLALQLAISHPTSLLAVIVAYPMADMEDSFWSTSQVDIPHDELEQANLMIEEHLSSLPDGPYPLSRPTDYAAQNIRDAILHSGRYSEFFGTEPHFFPLRRFQNNPQVTHRFPFLWIQHGTADSKVPVTGSRKLVTLLQQLNPDMNVRYTELPDGEHGVSSEILLITLGEWHSGIGALNNVLFCKT